MVTTQSGNTANEGPKAKVDPEYKGDGVKERDISQRKGRRRRKVIRLARWRGAHWHPATCLQLLLDCEMALYRVGPQDSTPEMERN